MDFKRLTAIIYLYALLFKVNNASASVLLIIIYFFITKTIFYFFQWISQYIIVGQSKLAMNGEYQFGTKHKNESSVTHFV